MHVYKYVYAYNGRRPAVRFFLKRGQVHILCTCVRVSTNTHTHTQTHERVVRVQSACAGLGPEGRRGLGRQTRGA